MIFDSSEAANPEVEERRRVDEIVKRPVGTLAAVALAVALSMALWLVIYLVVLLARS